MGLRHTIIGISAAILAPGAMAQTLSSQWVEIANNHMGDSVPDYSAAVLANDPTLALTPARTFDLVVTTTSPIRWASCELQINLSGSQAFYLSPNGSMRDPKAATWAAQPANEFSTFLCVPTFQHLNAFPGVLLGMAQYPVESGVGTAVLGTTKMDAAWGNAPAATTGTATVARLTFLNSFDGSIQINGRMGVANNVISPQDVYFGYGFRPAAVVASNNADANADGRVDTRDFNVVAGHFGQMGSLPVSSGNFNADLMVNSLDLNVLLAQYGTHPSGAPLGASVPEPTSLALLAAASLLLKRKRIQK
jgi:hypothetical protein